jgi:hypothetical protein
VCVCVCYTQAQRGDDALSRSTTRCSSPPGTTGSVRLVLKLHFVLLLVCLSMFYLQAASALCFTSLNFIFCFFVCLFVYPCFIHRCIYSSLFTQVFLLNFIYSTLFARLCLQAASALYSMTVAQKLNFITYLPAWCWALFRSANDAQDPAATHEEALPPGWQRFEGDFAGDASCVGGDASVYLDSDALRPDPQRMRSAAPPDDDAGGRGGGGVGGG